MTVGVNEDYRIGFQTHYSITPVLQFGEPIGKLLITDITNLLGRIRHDLKN